jgi:hypothetical protein
MMIDALYYDQGRETANFDTFKDLKRLLQIARDLAAPAAFLGEYIAKL